jgi:GNAT superfamily N-acetyltransferase
VDSSAPLAIRTATEGDIVGIAAVAIACGQPPTDSGADAAYAHHLLANGEVAVAVDRRGAVVGFGATRRVGSTSVLTDLFVDPSRQARGVGRSLLEWLWGENDEPRMTFSSQHPSAMPLYGRFSLAPLWPLLYLTGAPEQLERTALTIRTVPAEEAAAAELALTGVDRRTDYAYWLRDGAHRGLILLANGRPVAAGATRPGEVIHVASASAADAKDALIASVMSLTYRTVAVCVPGPHPGLPALLRRGFTVVDFDIHMATDASLAPATNVYSPALA